MGAGCGEVRLILGMNIKGCCVVETPGASTIFLGSFFSRTSHRRHTVTLMINLTWRHVSFYTASLIEGYEGTYTIIPLFVFKLQDIL